MIINESLLNAAEYMTLSDMFNLVIILLVGCGMIWYAISDKGKK
jgi:hypothetical protein